MIFFRVLPVFDRALILLIGIANIQVTKAGVYLNETRNVTNVNLTVTDGFLVAFRTCTLGTLFTLENNNFTVEIKNSTLFPVLQISWNHNDSLYSTMLTPMYLMNLNMKMTLELVKNDTGYNFRLSSSGLKGFTLDPVQNYIDNQFFQDLNSSNRLIIGSEDFVGCLFGGKNINLEEYNTECPLDFGQPCPNKVCPNGFAGVYCQTNIDDCEASTKQCQRATECQDLIGDFKCVCLPGWTGKLCNKYNGSFCDPNPCRNSGICRLIEDKSNYTCLCLEEYTGRNCEIKNYPCLSSPCLHGGVCFNYSTNDYNCTCRTGFTGVNCERNINDCAKGPCNYGKCIDGINNFTCDCTGSGFQGSTCNEDINECTTTKPCRNNATCENKHGNYECKCLQGFIGDDCEVDVDDCDSSPCVNGTCVDGVNNYSCSCYPGFKGRNCEIDINECDFGFCQNNASCEDRVNDYECNCTKGFEGKNCSTETDECRSSPCKNNGTCKDGMGTFTCECVTGFDGADCSNNINDCRAGFCGNGTCHDAINNYTCTCFPGFTGRHCEVDIDDCKPNPCQNYGSCNDRINDYNCSCIPSYTGKNCTEFRDPCIPNPCGNNGTCMNDTVKGYKCNCTSDFGGPNCEFAVGFCFPNNPCEHGNCTDFGGQYNCSCDKGYEGKNCSEDINECQTTKANFCKNGGKCVNTNGSFFCDCKGTGFEGINCVDDQNECENNPCDNGGVCVNQNKSESKNGFLCACTGGHTGRLCEKFYYACAAFKTENKTDYCKNGTCNELGSFKKNCSCYAGYEGDRCETEINECDAGLCQNATNCTDLINDYNCSCIPGFTGKNCDEDINECDPEPCENNSSCSDLINRFECKCKPGYNGTRCENDIDWCSYQPCKHGSNCTDIVQTYTCDCYPGYKGKNCSEDVNECQPNPCIYDDTTESICVERSNVTAMKMYNYTINATSYHDRAGYICKCLEGLSGINCTVNENDCNGTICENNGTCQDLINDYKCVCPNDYEGKNCERFRDACNPSPCGDGGSCRKVEKTFECKCRNGYTGFVCNITTTVNFNGSGYWDINYLSNFSPQNFSISLRFITTLAEGNLVTFAGNPDYSLSLSQGQLVLRSSNNLSRIKRLKVDGKSYVIGNDGKWHTLLLQKPATEHWSIYIDNETVSEADNFEPELKQLHIGGSSKLLKDDKNYIGCIQDVRINGTLFVPLKNGTLHNATAGACNRREVCKSDACNERGECIDEWTTNSCRCGRQYFGEVCQFEIQSFSFKKPESAANSTRNRRSVSDNQFVRSSVSFTMDSENNTFSFLIRTRQKNGFIALLTSKVPQSLSDEFSYTILTLNESRLDIRSQVAGDLSRGLSSFTVSNGLWNEVEVSTRNVTIKTSGSNYGTTLELTGHPTAVIFVGDVDRSNSILVKKFKSFTAFDGCIQAVKAGDSFLTSQNIPNVDTTSVSLNGAELNCTGRNGCEPDSCLYGGRCNDLWDAYNCTCRQGFAGQNCSLFGCKLENQCAVKEDCIDVPDNIGKTKCSLALTYNGINSSTTINVGNVSSSSLSFSIRTRQANGFLLSSDTNAIDRFIAIGIIDGVLTVVAQDSNKTFRINGTKVSDGEWRNVILTNGSLVIKLANDSRVVNNSTEMFYQDWFNIVTNKKLEIGSPSNSSKNKFFSNPYKGCFKGLFIGGAFYNLSGNGSSKDTINNCTGDNVCPLDHNPCVHGKCVDIFNDFICQCPQFYTKKTCNETINITCSFNGTELCKNNATCINLDDTTARTPTVSQNGKDFFRCECLAGFVGDNCSINFDECSANPCNNSRNCTDGINDYSCECLPGWEGKNCSEDIDECATNPCQNRGTCSNNVNNYSCNCTGTGYEGKNCTHNINECNLSVCQNNATCIDTPGDYNCSCQKSYFGKNCQHNFTVYCEIVQPCQNNGICQDNITDFSCNCTAGFEGKTCQDKVKGSEEDSDNTGLIVGIVVGVVAFLILLIVFVYCVFNYCKEKSGMEGTYSPNKEEQQSGNVEMHSMKKPKPERLI